MPLLRGSGLPSPLDYLHLQLGSSSPLMPYFYALKSHLPWENYLPVTSIPTALNHNIQWGLLDNGSPYIAFSLDSMLWTDFERSSDRSPFVRRCQPITNVIHTAGGVLNETHDIPGLSLLDIELIKYLFKGYPLKHSHHTWPEYYAISLVKPDYFTQMRSTNLRITLRPL